MYLYVSIWLCVLCVCIAGQVCVRACVCVCVCVCVHALTYLSTLHVYPCVCVCGCYGQDACNSQSLHHFTVRSHTVIALGTA